MLRSVFGFLIILGPLVVFHEFGHYIFARLFNVKAEIFSIGFGPRLWFKQLGETELRISAIPLGGYVKLLGEDRDSELSPELAKRALHKQAAWKRFFIFFGGPLFNFLLAIFVFMAILLIGEPHIASVVGRVVRHSVAEKAGFKSGDKIISIDGKPVLKFDEVVGAINDNPSKKMDFQVEHSGSPRVETVSVTPSQQDGFSVYGESTHVGEIEGLLAGARSTDVGISDPGSPAGRAGVKTSDQVIAVNGTPITTWEELENTYWATKPGTDIKLTFSRGEPKKTIDVTFAKPRPDKNHNVMDMGEAWGLFSSELFVKAVVPKSPAEAAGVQPGDRLVGVGGKVVQSFFDLRDAVQRAGEKEGKVDLQLERAGKIISYKITPTATETQDPLLKKTMQYTVGVAPMLVVNQPNLVVERILNPFKLLYAGTERMITFSWRNLVSVLKMFTGDVSVATLGGPILIGKIAGESLSHGLIAFLSTMAILSIGLGVLNILPIPVLDGGHLVLLLLEGIRGKPLTMRQMEIVQQVGLSLILLLMVIVIRNDLSRLPFFE